ncbi:hypothetical protein PMKS-002228 [Pichia membranifaciens]|uniref:GAF domain-containing protein n=1 Tax=Pichia membranifaciens TaxID=4926 RepID=A0A1Q2YH89_9ASCO|nr:hypothetical protein PMKS-002228 [Pichia membranifaciens]
MSVSAQRRSSYRQSASGLRCEEYSPARKFRIEGYERQNNFDRSKANLLDNGNTAANKVLFENNLISNKDYDLFPSPFTKELFLEYYALGKQNLSTIEYPPSLEGTTFLKAPESYHEIRRLNTVEKYMNLPHWEHSNRFNVLLKKMMSMFNCKGAALSLIDSRLQIIKFQYGLGFDQCSRQVSFDSHAILSSGFFLLLDATKDWRFKTSPIVKSSPNIKFYLGVPLIASNKQVIGVLSIFDSFARCNNDESTIKIMKKMSSEIMEYLGTPIKKRSNDHRDGTGKMLQSPCLPMGTNTRYRDQSSNSNKLLEMYGRATSNNKRNEEIIFEKDGSGTSYTYNSSLKFSKYSCPYDDLIDLNVWKKLSRCENLRKASNLLCELLMNKLGLDCVYICNVKVTKKCWINKQFYPLSEREIELENYKFENKIGWADEENENEDEVLSDFGNMKMKVIGMAARDTIVESKLDSDNAYEFHSKVIRSVNGLNYQSADSRVIFHSGYSLPFYRHPNKLVRKSRMKELQSDRSEIVELFFKSNGYLITCFDSDGRDISESEIGYVYGCSSILRRIFFY